MERTKDYAIGYVSGTQSLMKPRNPAACSWRDPWLTEGGRLWYVPWGDKRDKQLFMNLVMKAEDPAARIKASVLQNTVANVGVLKRKGTWTLELTAARDIQINGDRRTNYSPREGLSLEEAWKRARGEAAFRRLDEWGKRPSKLWSDVFGLRGWSVEGGVLHSPSQGTPWIDKELVAHGWTDEGAVRGKAGIHALLVPRSWKQATSHWFADDSATGIVERHGRFVLGEDGWRAEQATIRVLAAPTLEIQMQLMGQYPDVPVFLRSVRKWI